MKIAFSPINRHFGPTKAFGTICYDNSPHTMEENINEFGRIDELKESVDKAQAKEYFEKLEGVALSPFKVSIRVHNLLQKFIATRGLDI